MTEAQPQDQTAAAVPNPLYATAETPTWLSIPPTGGDIPLPVQTNKQLLPLSSLGWDDFERLCFKLIRTEVGPARAAIYGVPGQAQQGIDMYAVVPIASEDTLNERRYVTLQSRRISNVSPASVESAVNDFLKRDWALVSQKFIYAISSSARVTQVLDKIEALAKLLDEHSVAFEVWDQERISEMLKERPELVDDFFGRPWVDAFCGKDAAHQLGNRLQARDMTKLREELARIYAATFRLADPGFTGFGLSEIRRVGLLDRFVPPDLVSATPQTASYPYRVAVESEAGSPTAVPRKHSVNAEDLNAWFPDEHGWSLPSAFDTDPIAPPETAVERRPANQWIGTEQLQVIIGDPGAGKSTLLRYLVLDLLREEPQWKTVAEHWGNYLPVWLPFNFLAQRFVGQTGESASVRPALKSWLDQNESPQIWPLMERALQERRLLLVVDGLDEWTSDDAGHYAARAVERLAAIGGIPVVASTRPYGLTRLTLDSGWVYSRIAPFTHEQQRSLANYYFRAAADGNSSASSADIIDRSVDEFLAQVHLTPELSAFSGTPLFLILLVMLRLSSASSLPAQRFEVYERAVQLLVQYLPTRRRTAADVTTAHRGLPQHHLEALLRKVSYVNQSRGNVSVFDEESLRQDFVDALEDPGGLSMSRERAALTANQLLDVAEGELGLLVRIGPKHLGFIHRVMQEQLAAHHIADSLEFCDVKDLFEKYVGDPTWREVLLITFRKISRASEKSSLLATVQNRIDETPAGLCAREFLAEITFGPYGLSRDDVQSSSSGLVDVIETHPYGPHRTRLLDAVLTGIDGPLTDGIVLDCLKRWTVLVSEPSRQLVALLARIPPDTGFSETICRLLVSGLRNADRYDAFDKACAIAQRCATIGTEEERSYLRAALMNILADPPTGLAQAAALSALALGWRDNPKVAAALDEARFHPDDQVRLVGVCDALDVLGDAFPNMAGISHPVAQALSEAERAWLLEYLWTPGTPDVHFGMLVAAISATVRGDQSVLGELLDFHSSDEAPRFGLGVTQTVMLRAFAHDAKVADWVSSQIREDGPFGLKQDIGFYDVDELTRAYQKGSPHNSRVADSIEHILSDDYAGGMERSLFGLAAIDQGPIMKQTLLKLLVSSSIPHWAADALAEYFYGDAEVQDKFMSILTGDPDRASMVANAAPKFLDPRQAIPQLMDILGSLATSQGLGRQRYDIVASALIQSYRKLDPSDRLELEGVLLGAMDLIPKSVHWLYGNPRLALAAELYPAEGALVVLNEIAERDDRPIEAFIHVFREDAERLEPFLKEASTILRSLPPYLRAHVCRSLTERRIEPRLVSELTARWADERSEPNKSVASYTYHQALVRINQEEQGNEETWNLALAHLRDQASISGLDHEARRRAAWVGMCVLGDWSPVLDRVETVDNSDPLSVRLGDYLGRPDRILLQQIGDSWSELRSTFGEQLLARLSGPFESSPDSVWNYLALVAGENPSLERDLENEVATNPQLRTDGGIFLWTIRRRANGSIEVSEALKSLLRDSQYPYDDSICHLLTQPERLGLQPWQIQEMLEQSAQGSFEGLAFETLAVLFPDHPMVLNAWKRVSELQESSDYRSTRGVNTRTYLALCYSVSASDEIVSQIQAHHHRLCKLGNPYFDRLFTRNVSHRLRRDASATGKVQEAILNPETPDALAAVCVALLCNAVGLDDQLLTEIERRMSQQTGRTLANVVHDPNASSSLPVRTIFLDAAEGPRRQRIA